MHLPTKEIKQKTFDPSSGVQNYGDTVINNLWIKRGLTNAVTLLEYELYTYWSELTTTVFNMVVVYMKY